MPYFIYKIDLNRNLDLLETYSKYREARDQARKLRSELPAEDTGTIKMIHAKGEAEALHLLKQVREPRPMGEE